MTLKDFTEIKIPSLLTALGVGLQHVPTLVDMEKVLGVATQFVGFLTACVGFGYMTYKFLNERQKNIEDGKRSK